MTAPIPIRNKMDDYAPSNAPFEVIFKDEDIIAINKPSGLLSVPGRLPEHKDSVQNRILDEHPTALLIHRLDLETSGLMIMALNKDTQKKINLQFEKREVLKTYIADIWGHPKTQSGNIDQPLICDWPNRPRQIIDHENGKSAQTYWEVLEKHKVSTRVLLKPTTGRSHQLRVHMQYLNHPILGDSLYAHDAAYEIADRLHLHAQTLNFTHPGTGKKLKLKSPCPFRVDEGIES